MKGVQLAASISCPKTAFERKIGKIASQDELSHIATATETANVFSTADTPNGIGQTSIAYTLSGGATNVGVEEVKQKGDEHAKIIHSIPIMTDTERDTAKRRIGSDLYEIFLRIQAELCLDNELTQK